jgi:hypothetical protein
MAIEPSLPCIRRAPVSSAHRISAWWKQPRRM